MGRAQGVAFGEANWITRFIYRALKRSIGQVPKSAELQAHQTSLLVAATWMNSAQLKARTISGSLKELIQLKVAAMVGCPF